MYTIIVNDNPKTGACSVLEHFNEHWVGNEKLHPVAKAAEVEINAEANEDSIIVKHNDKEIIRQENNEALRLDKLQSGILAHGDFF